jgi:putative transposase
MKRAKFTEAKIAFVPKQVEYSRSLSEVCHKAGIFEATFCNWRKKYGGLMPSEMQRLELLEEENS